ncbi:PD-(D/E)XK nuclease family protein [Haemophilus haemoglobinophilus]|nr:PD-(D/E)XK nuclease family protein [Canicola haemoglobinophilus]MBN6711733.1 PD-(D/E)XK nuclease family protein [Canicola haemoglobinophilus]
MDTEFTPQLEDFFTEWNKRSFSDKDDDNFDPKQLSEFFNQWRKLGNIIEPKKEQIIPIPKSEQLKNFFIAFQEAQKPIEAERQLGMFANVWQAANLGRNEVRNSKTLRWFLDMYANHGQGSLFLQAVYQCLPKDFLPLPKEYRATEECCPLGEETDRVDIEIESDNLLLFIEVKIDAQQGKRQLERYINVAKKKSGSRPWGIIYLTKDGILPKEINDKERVVGISWHQLAKALEVLTKQKSKLEPNNRGIWLAEQFIQHILTF